MKNLYLLVLVGCIFYFHALQAEPMVSSQDQKTLTEIEQTVQQLKEETYRSKAKLRELEEAVLQGKITSAKAFIEFNNQAEGFFAFSSAEFYLDDQMIQRIEGEAKDKKKRSDPVKTVKVFDGDIPSGEHKIRAKIFYRGSDKSIYSAFPYFKDHQFELETIEKFSVDYGKTSVIKLTALDKGYFKKDLKERLHLQIQVVQDWGAEPLEQQ